ncbi:MAG: AI-2E family transporter, partial [Fusobacteriaceae bacterium]
MKKQYVHIFVVGFILILLQTFLQYNSSFGLILNELLSSIKPFIYAIFIAILVSPLVKVFENKMKLKRTWSILLSLIIVFTAMIGLILIVIPNIIASISDLVEKFPTMMSSLTSNTVHLLDFLKSKNLLFFNPEEIEANLVKFIKTNLGNFKNLAFGLGAGVLKSLVGVLNFFIGVFISLYLMY